MSEQGPFSKLIELIPTIVSNVAAFFGFVVISIFDILFIVKRYTFICFLDLCLSI